MAETFTPYYGQNRPTSGTSEYNSIWFMVDQMIKRISTATLVQVGSVTTTSDIAPIGNLSATPLVHMIDGANNVSKHGAINNLCYSRMQSGNRAIIMDPSAGDIGLAVFADRDISAAKKTKKASQPGSRRRFDVADGIYVMTVLSATTPNSYVRFRPDGTIIVGVGPAGSAWECVVAADHVQIKHRGDTAMHVTIGGGNITMGKAAIIAPDPYPGD